MLKQNGGGICDHQVGTGKTLIMCMAAHEMKRLGMVHKPMIIGLKANVAEIAATYQAAYPNARILYASEKDFSAANRVRFFNNIKNNDYDCVIMSHDQFGKIPQSPELQQRILQEELDTVEENLDVMRRQGKDISRGMLKGLEKRKFNLTAKLEKIEHDIRSRTDDVVDFRQMGIDHIFIDESHQFKNLTFNTRHDRVAGLGNSEGSQKALNMLFAIRTIQERTGKDLGATFLSGTTISNSLTELYLLFKYLRPKELERQDIRCFDAWAAIFAKKTTDFEFNVTNNIVQKERFRYFIKVPELAAFYNEITDYRTAEDVGVDRPDKNEILHHIPPTPDQEDFIGRLMKFAQTGTPRSLAGRRSPKRKRRRRCSLQRTMPGRWRSTCAWWTRHTRTTRTTRLPTVPGRLRSITTSMRRRKARSSCSRISARTSRMRTGMSIRKSSASCRRITAYLPMRSASSRSARARRHARR